MNTKYAYGYVRVSTDKQEELSPESQEKLLREYAKNHNMVLLDIFFEIGVSGRKANKRPEFQKMVSMAKSEDHPVDCILVWKFSRFARNQEESIVYKSLLKKQHSVDVISVTEPLLDGPWGSLIERIIEWMDEYYSINLSNDVLTGMGTKARKEGYQTSPPLGYQAVGEGRPFTINEDEFKIVSYIADQYDNHNRDFTWIARHLNSAGYHTRRGKPFEGRGIERILRNPFYYGLVQWNGIEFIGAHEVRFTKDRFDARIQKMDSRYRPKKRRNVSTCSHWLSGLLKCGTCGASMTYNGANHCPGFQCYKYAKGQHAGSMFISEKKITAAVYEYFEKLFSGMEFEYEYRPEKSSDLEIQVASLKDELRQIEFRESRIRLAFEKGIDSLEEYSENKERLKLSKLEIEKKIEEFSTPSDEKPDKSVVLDHLHTVYDMIKDPGVDYETKGSFMRSLVKDIVYDKEKGRVIFHLYLSKPA